MAPLSPIPLWRPEITPADGARLAAQLERAPFHDPALLARWEGTWAALWERPALAFATPDEVVGHLAALLGWGAGREVAVHPLLPPHWSEALTGACLTPRWLDPDPPAGAPPADPSAPSPLFHHHPFGLPTPPPAISSPLPVLEEVSSLLVPFPGSGGGDVQLLCLDGNRMVNAGATCLVLSRDEGLIAGLRRLRRYPPGAAACALGSAQLERLPAIREGRARLAERYLALRHRGWFAPPPGGEGERAWDAFVVTCRDGAARDSLQAFLARGGIGAAPPVWWRLPPGAAALPGVAAFQARALALPLYTGLGEADQKRIVNRIHRWIERRLEDIP